MPSANVDQKAPPGSMTLTEFDVQVQVSASCCSSGYVSIDYYGSAEGLLAAGVATPEMLAHGRPGRSRTDSDGDPVSLRRWWIGVTIKPEQRFRVTRRKQIDRLPYAREAMAAYEAREDWYEALRAGRSIRPALRLVVDNTVRP